MYTLVNRNIIVILLSFGFMVSSLNASQMVGEPTKKSLVKRFISTACAAFRTIAGIQQTVIGSSYMAAGVATLIVGNRLVPHAGVVKHSTISKLRNGHIMAGLAFLFVGGYCFKKGWDWIDGKWDLKRDIPKLFVVMGVVPAAIIEMAAFFTLHEKCTPEFKDDLGAVYHDAIFGCDASV